MPNWCYTTYKFFGPKKDIEKLHDSFKYLPEFFDEHKEDDWDCAKNWIGLSVVKSGLIENPNDITSREIPYCRCFVEYVEDCVDKETCSSFTVYCDWAWSPSNDFIDWILQQLGMEDVCYAFYAEEPNMRIYITNSFKNFPDKYVFDVYDDQTYYYTTLEDLWKNVEETIDYKIPGKTFKELQAFVEEKLSDKMSVNEIELEC